MTDPEPARSRTAPTAGRSPRPSGRSRSSCRCSRAPVVGPQPGAGRRCRLGWSATTAAARGDRAAVVLALWRTSPRADRCHRFHRSRPVPRGAARGRDPGRGDRTASRRSAGTTRGGGLRRLGVGITAPSAAGAPGAPGRRARSPCWPGPAVCLLASASATTGAVAVFVLRVALPPLALSGDLARADVGRRLSAGATFGAAHSSLPPAAPPA